MIFNFEDIKFCEEGKQELRKHLSSCKICYGSTVELLHKVAGLPFLSMLGINKKQIDELIKSIMEG